MNDVDALLVLSFGGPEAAEDVVPFLRKVTHGRNVPDERLAAVAEHYHHFGGVSPINGQNRALIEALRNDFAAHDLAVPIYWGNRNWHPFLVDTVRQMRQDGIGRALVFTTSATASYSACRQYRDNLADAIREVDQGAPELVKLRHYFDHPGYIRAVADAVRTGLAEVGDDARLVFTAHSVPVAMNTASGPFADGLYAAQHRETARLVAEAVRGPGAEFDLAWQSRSGPAHVPWLGPSVGEQLAELAAAGEHAVLAVPSGFVSDHHEVRWDLDHEARRTARRLGLRFARAATAGTHPAFVAAIRELVTEQLRGTQPRWLGRLGLCGVDCPPDCCRTSAGAAGN